MMGKEGERLIKGAGTIQPCIFVPQVINQCREVARKVRNMSQNFANQKMPVFSRNIVQQTQYGIYFKQLNCPKCYEMRSCGKNCLVYL